MRTKFFALAIFPIAILLMGCNKGNINIKDGTYKGTFTATYKSGTKTGQTTLEVKNGRFKCFGNPNRIPAGGSGSCYSDNNKITFNDENYWTADFDWNLILNGQYEYSFNGKILKMSADKTGDRHYEYDLKKQ